MVTIAIIAVIALWKPTPNQPQSEAAVQGTLTPSLTNIPTLTPALTNQVSVSNSITSISWKTHTDKTFNLTLHYPDKWQVDAEPEEGCGPVFFNQEKTQRLMVCSFGSSSIDKYAEKFYKEYQRSEIEVDGYRSLKLTNLKTSNDEQFIVLSGKQIGPSSTTVSGEIDNPYIIVSGFYDNDKDVEEFEATFDKFVQNIKFNS